jgi:Fe-Mn family superoxide dismutase
MPKLSLPDLPYSYDALQPYMSRETLELHHDKHHQVYVDNTNVQLQGSGLEDRSLEDIVKNAPRNSALFNNAAQHYNHLHFWKWMKANGGGANLSSTLKKWFDRDLGGFEKARDTFVNAGLSRFGSGWAWIALKDDKLSISNSPNGENPLIADAIPILGCDVWEHAYYVDYRNRRADYLKAFWDHLINWDYVEELFENARSKGG